MTRIVSRLGDRLLAAVVPETTAAAACEEYCWTERTSCASGQLSWRYRTCCRYRSCVLYCGPWKSGGQCPR